MRSVERHLESEMRLGARHSRIPWELRNQERRPQFVERKHLMTPEELRLERQIAEERRAIRAALAPAPRPLTEDEILLDKIRRAETRIGILMQSTMRENKPKAQLVSGDKVTFNRLNPEDPLRDQLRSRALTSDALRVQLMQAEIRKEELATALDVWAAEGGPVR